MTHQQTLARGEAATQQNTRFLNVFDFVDFAGLFEDGIPYPRMSEIMYGNYHLWEAVARGPGYRAMHDALEEVDVSIVQAAAKEIGKRGIRHVISMGPTAKVDASLLERLANEGIPVTYTPADVNESANTATIDYVKQHLTDKVGDSWKKFISIGEPMTKRFSEVNSNGQLDVNGPACVVYSGGSMMNDPRFWGDAGRIAQKGGLVVASAACQNQDQSSADAYWLSIYDTPEGKALFTSALQQLAPELFLPEHKGKWEIGFEYVPHIASTSQWAYYNTPRISVQLQVNKPIVLTVDNKQLTIPPTRSWKEVAEWENPNGAVRQQFDSDASVTQRIEQYRKTGNISDLPELCQRMYPIELIQSAKPPWGAFLMTTPQAFGLSNIVYSARGIEHRVGDAQGLAIAGLFSADNPHSNWITLKEPRLWQPLPFGSPHA